jgi:hypothetical protein
MLVIAAAPLIPVVVLVTTPETSDAVRVIAPVLPATLVTDADAVPPSVNDTIDPLGFLVKIFPSA